MESELVEIHTGSQENVHDLTRECERFLSRVSDGADGLLHVFVPHATAGVALIETGAGSERDLLAALRETLPPDSGWRHKHGSPGHGRDHLVPAFVAPYASLPVVGGRTTLGTWQSVCLVDTNLDNPTRSVRLSFLPG